MYVCRIEDRLFLRLYAYKDFNYMVHNADSYRNKAQKPNADTILILKTGDTMSS